MDKIVEQAFNQDPRALYLQQLGVAIANLTHKQSDNYYFGNTDDMNRRTDFINDIHSKAMEIIKTMDKNTSTK